MPTRGLNEGLKSNSSGGKKMENTVIEQANETLDESREAKTFTQEEVDTIVKNRLIRESAKYANYDELKEKASKFDEMEEAGKSELQKATEKAEHLQKQLDEIKAANEIRSIREKVANETGIPLNLLTANTEEECKVQAEAILAFKGQSASPYPTVRDGGEVNHTTKKDVKDQFADWFNNSLK